MSFRDEAKAASTHVIRVPCLVQTILDKIPAEERDEVEMAREAIERQGVKAIILTREWEVIGRRRCCDE